MLTYERVFWQGHPCGGWLAGVDEAGRGPLAGPVVAAAVMVAPQLAERLYADALRDLTDSKQLTPLHREQFYAILSAEPDVLTGVGWVSADEIDDLNILNATHLAMRRALLALSRCPDHALVDGLPPSGLPCSSTAIVRGDSLSFLIAAASVVAKVLRDRYMIELDRRYPGYDFTSNKGYGTNSHVRALLRLGPCPEHRRSFRPVQDSLELLPGLRDLDVPAAAPSATLS